ncbi:lipoprotein [Providencia rettgeri]|nr:hypothetical protein [Providencia rettgeri]WHT81970.1 hypothetical protein KOL65_21855 [Providencia rettgeri]
MKKLFFGFALVLLISGCNATNPPDAPKAKGKWVEITTNLKEIQAK